MEAIWRWAASFTWFLGQLHVTYTELTLNFEAHAGRALPVPGDHWLRGVTLPPRTKGQVMKQPLDRLQPHMQIGNLLHGKEVWMTKSLLPLGGFRCGAHEAVRPGRGQQDYLLLDYFPLVGPGHSAATPLRRLAI